MHRNALPDRAVRPLKRGKACLTCRFLKIKCDGARPLCGPCTRHPKDDPCEYADGPGRSRTRALEDKIERLEAKIQELEDPERATPSITLHHPYTSPEPELRLTMPPPAAIPSTSTLASPDSYGYGPPSPFSVTSTLSSRSSPIGQASALTLSPPSPAPHLSDIEEHAMRGLLDRFFLHSTEFGWFLHSGAFYSSALGHSPKPLPALLRVVCLWGIHLSPGDASSTLGPTRFSETDFLMRSLAEASTALAQPSDQSHPQKVLQAIQARVLLAYYFFRSGRSLEARCESNAAAALALGCGLHKVRSNAVPPNDGQFLAESRNTIEEGERINGFWAVSTLVKNLAVALEPPSSVCGVFEAPGLAIDTPWPMDMESYKQGLLPRASTLTIQNFLTQPKHEDMGSASMPLAEMYAKASVLFHRATYLSGQFTPTMQTHKSQAFVGAFDFLDRLMEAFRASIPPISHLDPTNPGTRTVCLSHALICGATIQLHGLLARSNTNSRQRCIDSARAMLQLGGGYGSGLNWQDFQNVNPIMGTLFMLACQVFIDEIAHLQSSHQAGVGHGAWQDSTSVGTEEGLIADLQTGLSALSFFARESAMMSKSLSPYSSPPPTDERFLWGDVVNITRDQDQRQDRAHYSHNRTSSGSSAGYGEMDVNDDRYSPSFSTPSPGSDGSTFSDAQFSQHSENWNAPVQNVGYYSHSHSPTPNPYPTAIPSFG